MRLGVKSKTAEENAANRAEELRKKRTGRSQKRVSEATQRAAHPVRVRPIVVRGSEFGTPIHQRAAKKSPRRAFYVTVDRTAGTELRLPSVPAFHPGWRLVSGIIAIAALFGIFTMWNSDTFRVGGVEVQGLERISAEDINKTLNLDNYSVVEIDTHTAVQQITSAFPELVNVRVQVKLPNLVSMSARERQPVLAWQKGDSVQWLDAEGAIFPARGEAGPLVTLHTEDDLPPAAVKIDIDAIELTAAAGEDEKPAAEKPVAEPDELKKVDPALIAAAQSLSQKLPQDTTLVYSQTDGLGWVDPQGWQVFIGTDLQNFEAKYNLYQTLAKHLNDQGQTPALVSVEHLNAPFYRLEP